MKKIFFFYLVCIVLFTSRVATAQSFYPFATWNHAGVTGMHLQPASIADTRLKFDMIILGLDVNAGNSLYELKKGYISGGFDDFDDHKVVLKNMDNRRIQFGLDVQPLNFMVPLSQKSALGFSTRVRTMINVDGVDPDLFNIIEYDLMDFVGNSYSIKDLSFRANAWAEMGLTYAREVIDLNHHYVKAGITLKILQPVTSAYIYIEDAGYSIKINPNDPDIQDIWFKAKGEMAVPSAFKEFDDFTDPGNLFDDWDPGKRIGFG